MWCKVVVFVITVTLISSSQRDAVLSSDNVPKETFSNRALNAVLKNNNEFTGTLYKEIKRGNMIVSPLSMVATLGLAYTGASGRTAHQIATALNFQPELITTGFRKLMKFLKNSKMVDMKIVSAMFSQTGFPISEEFSTVARKSFMAKVDTVNFSNYSVGATSIINRWIKRKTKRKIRNIIPAGMLTSDTRLVIVNAVYFKGLWKRPFNIMATSFEDFYVTNDLKINVQMMHTKAYFGYSKLDSLDATLLEMPYENSSVSMLILLPNIIGGLTEMENKLDSTNMSLIFKKHPVRQVTVAIPKFKFQKSTRFKYVLKKLGIKDMFEKRVANFSGITDGEEGLYVKELFQKGFIDVNENGTEAGICTALIMASMSLKPPHLEFVANHPFLFIIWEKTLKTVLFMGRLTHPK